MGVPRPAALLMDPKSRCITYGRGKDEVKAFSPSCSNTKQSYGGIGRCGRTCDPVEEDPVSINIMNKTLTYSNILRRMMIELFEVYAIY